MRRAVRGRGRYAAAGSNGAASGRGVGGGCTGGA